MIDTYISLLIDVRHAIVESHGANPLACGISHDLTEIINVLAKERDVKPKPKLEVVK